MLSNSKIFHSKTFAVIILFCLGFIIYSNMLDSSFHFDDYNSIAENLSIRNPAALKTLWNYWPTRFITYYSFALNYHFHKLNVFGYHLFNLAIHIISAILVWWLTHLSLSSPAMKDDTISHQANLIAFFAGLVFIAHPIQTQAVTYTIQRTASLAALFYLLSLSLYAKSRLLQLQSQNLRVKISIYYTGSLITAVLAMFTKEMAITLPLMIFLYELCFLKNKKDINFRPLIPFLITLFIIPLTMLLTKSVDFLQMRRAIETGPDISPLHYLLTQFRVMITYLRLFFIPLNQNLDYDYTISQSLWELPTLASLLLLTLILITAIRIFSRYRLVSFAVLWFFLTLLPESSIIPIKDLIFEHRLYLPMAGFSLFLVSVSYYLLGKNNIKLMFFIIFTIVIWYSLLTYNRNLVWKDELTLLNDTIKKSPKKARPYNNRGLAYQNKGDIDKALSDFNKAIELNSNYADSYLNIGNVDTERGDLNQAILNYNKAIELNLYFALAYNNRGLAYKKKGNLDKAISDFNKTIEINPNCFDTYVNRGIVYVDKGNVNKALSDFNKAIEINPEYAQAYNNRGNIYADRGNLDRALLDFNKAIELNPYFALAYNNRGLAYRKKGNLDRAILDFNKAIEINPLSEAYANRGLIYQAQGNLDRALLDFNKAIEINPKYIQFYYDRAITYFYNKEYDKSWKDIHKIESLGGKVHPHFLKDLKKASGKKR